MNNFILDAESSVRLIVFASVFLLLALAELIWPRRRPAPDKWRRWFTNLGLSALNTLAVRFLVPVAGVASALYAEQRGLGLFALWSPPLWVQVALFVVIFDLTIYWQHRIYHLVPVLWRFHRVHHTDRDYDLTTGNRFHPVSILLSALIKIGLVLLMGAPALAILVAELLLNVTSMFNHSNLRLHAGVDRLLRWIIVTPDMHRIHHSVDTVEHNHNFGFNFSCWDRLFATYIDQPKKSHLDMTIGITGFDDSRTRQLVSLLLQPLREAGK